MARAKKTRGSCVVCGEKPATRGGQRCNGCYTRAMNAAGGAPTPAGRLEMRPAGWLRPHPLNQGIYRDGVDEAFVANIRANGVQSPIIATPDGTMVAGHRRREAARLACLDEVPVIIREYADEESVLEALIANNAQRVKTNEQLGREAIVVKTIEGRRGNGEGRWRDRAGELLGRSGETARQACIAVEEMDRREDLGDREGAQRIREALAQSVRRGYEEARGRTAASVPATVPEIDGQGDPRVMPAGEAGPDAGGSVVQQITDATNVQGDPPPVGAPTGTVVPPVVESPPEGDEEEGEEANPAGPAPERSGEDEGEEDEDAAMPTECPQGCPLLTREERIVFYLAIKLFPPLEQAGRGFQRLVAETLKEQAPGMEELLAHAERRIGKKPEGWPEGMPAPMVHYLAEADNALKKIKAHRPACRWCPSCALRGKGNGRECMRCHGRPYVTQAVWDAATDEGRRAALARGEDRKGAA